MKAEERKIIITQVARKIFSKYGLMKTTVNEIAKAAKMGKASLYHYFKSKEDIYKEVIEQENKFLKEKLRKAIQKENTPQEKIRTFILKKMEYLKKLANIHSALKDDYLIHYGFIKKFRQKNLEEELHIIKEILQDGINKGIFEVSDINLTAFAIISALRGLEYPWTISIPFPEIESNVNKLLEILFKGIEKK